MEIINPTVIDYSDYNKVSMEAFQADRLIDIEKELLRYESKYEIKSENFYLNWKSQPNLDQSDFNKWVDLYRLMQYAKK